MWGKNTLVTMNVVCVDLAQQVMNNLKHTYTHVGYSYAERLENGHKEDDYT